MKYTSMLDEAAGLPVKLNDDVMDALRYAVYNTHERLKARTIKKPKGLRG
ncbi:hypothetical protein TUA1478L_33740 [Lactiplantibacillus plantarum]